MSSSQIVATPLGRYGRSEKYTCEPSGDGHWISALSHSHHEPFSHLCGEEGWG